MKKTLFTSMLIILLLVGMVLQLPVVFAAPPTVIHVPSHQAEGTMDEYHVDLEVPLPNGGGWISNPDTIIRGHWRVQVFYSEEVEFKARFWEENGEWDGQQILGTIDTFKVSLLPEASFVFSKTEWEIAGTLEFHKKGWDPATGKPVFSTFTFFAWITITPSEIRINLDRYQPTTIPWDIGGTTALFDGQEYPPALLDGNKISVYFSDLERPVDEACFVIHGWMWDDWQSRSPTKQNQLLHFSSFELWVDGNKISMEKLVHWHDEYEVPSGTTFEDVVFVSYYVQFEANQFTAGDYTFKGVWKAPNNPTHTNEITVTFT